jgi:regulator of sigma E protease
MPGDRILSIDGEPIYLYEDVSVFLSMGDGEHYDIVVKRDGKRVVLSDLALSPKEYDNGDGTSSVRFGINFGEVVEATPLVKLKITALNSVDFVRLVWYSLKMLVTGQVGLSDVSGPVGVVSMISDVGQQASSVSIWLALQNIGYLTALIAINLAVMNLLPLPALDGGHIFLMYLTALITKITKKPVDPKYEGYLNYGGFVALMLLMVVVTASDIIKLFS